MGTRHAPTGVMPNQNEIFDPETYAIIGAAMTVHSRLGHGFLERVYKLALPIEFGRRKIPYVAESPLPISYDGVVLPTTYRVDFVCFKDVIVECKATAAITQADVAQLINYLKAARVRRGLILNFGAPSFQHARRVWG